MKKTYLVPTMQVVPVKMTQIICTSPGIQSNVDFELGGDTPSTFGPGDIR